MEVLRALVSHFLGEIQYFLILKMLLRHVLMIMCEFSKGTLSSGAEQVKPFFGKEVLERYQFSSQKQHF